MASYELVLEVLKSWKGTPEEKWQRWTQTYNTCPPPPPPSTLWTDETLARWISQYYVGPDPVPDPH